MSAQKKLTESQLAMAAKLLPEAVRQQALERPLAQVGLSCVYGVLSNWECTELVRAEDVVEVVSPDALHAALHGNDEHALLVRSDACTTLEALKEVLATSAYSRTVFYEIQA